MGVYFREPQASCENYSRLRLANAAVWAEGEGEMTGLRPASRPWTLTDDDMLRKLLASGMKQRLIHVASSDDTIDYVVTDTWGNTSTSTRTVIVQAASSSSPIQ